MSVSKKDQVFPGGSATSNERYVAQLIAKALRDDYGALGSAVKRIGRRIGAHPRAIRNWYEGRNAPNSMHLLLLAQSSPEVFRALLELLGRSDLLEDNPAEKSELNLAQNTNANQSLPGIYGEETFTIKVTVSPSIRCKLNHRQLWFLGLLQQGENLKAWDIAFAWGVTLRTARTDISDLIEQRLILFRGGNKTGKYVTHPPRGGS